MRRATTVLAACLCAITGCRGGAAQEPYDGVVVSGGAASVVASLPPVPTDEAEPIASEVDIPWTIALLSDATRPVEAPRQVIVVEGEPDAEVDAPPAEDVSVDVQLAVDHGADHKPPAIKICPGVVKGRS